MRLYLVQNGEAVAKEVDPDRPLSEHGREDIIRLAKWLEQRGVDVREIRHSGKTRTRQHTRARGPFLALSGVWRGHTSVATSAWAKTHCKKRNREQERPGRAAALSSGDWGLRTAHNRKRKKPTNFVAFFVS